jgi:ABC-type dipeptide/oligopeptide/nickel transport system permease component
VRLVPAGLVLGEDYIRTARSKGVSHRRVVYRYALRSALTPVAIQFGIDLDQLVGGVVVTSTISAVDATWANSPSRFAAVARAS